MLPISHSPSSSHASRSSSNEPLPRINNPQHFPTLNGSGLPDTNSKQEEVLAAFAGLTVQDPAVINHSMVEAIAAKVDRAKGTSLDALPAEIFEHVLAFMEMVGCIRLHFVLLMTP